MSLFLGLFLLEYAEGLHIIIIKKKNLTIQRHVFYERPRWSYSYDWTYLAIIFVSNLDIT
jgi:hypothetical protein